MRHSKPPNHPAGRGSPWADALEERLRAAAEREATVRAAAESARLARRRALDASHESTLSRQGRPYEGLFRTPRRKS